MKEKYNIKGMTCSACSSAIEKGLSKTNGVHSVNVNLLSNDMVVEYDENLISNDEIVNKVSDIGYSAALKSEKKDTNKSANLDATNELKEMKQRVIISFSALIFLMYISMGHMYNWPFTAIFNEPQFMLSFAFSQFLLLIPIVFVNRKYFVVGIKTLIKGNPNMDSLVAIGAGAAIVYGVYVIFMMCYYMGLANIEMVHHYMMDLYFESAGTILALITFGKYLEAKAKLKTNDAISKMLELTSKVATVIREGVEEVIDCSLVLVGDIFVVKPGEKIPVDGIVVEGSSYVDESAISGESMPVSKEVDSHVIGATINQSGYLKCKALKVGEDTTFAQIIELVSQASSSKAPISQLADRVSGVFVPSVILIAIMACITWLLLGYSFSFALSIGIGVLVISCPCALGLATPVAIMVAMGKGAESGILIKSASSLEIAHEVDVVVLDKTGTITLGKPQIVDISSSMNEDELIKIMASIENKSQHPIAFAFNELATQKKLSLLEVSDFESFGGMGVSGIINKTTYFIGNLSLMHKMNVDCSEYISIADGHATKGYTPLFISAENTVLGVVSVGDKVKSSSATAIKKLKELGLRVVMLSGDNTLTAKAIGEEVGVNEIFANVLPQEKEIIVKKFQDDKHKVLMVGDGINDAIALMRADVGIAIGSGSDIALESSDIVLLHNDLIDVVNAISLSKATIKNIKQNLFWAFFYNTLGIPLAAGVFYLSFNLKLNPMIGALAMSLSSVFVVSNALRLKRFKPFKLERKQDKKMRKEIIIDNMMCMHCVGRVKKALTTLPNVSVEVNLDKKCAYIESESEIDNATLTKLVEDAGYVVVEIK